MTVTLTNRLGLSKPDDAELVSIALLDSNFDKIDNDFRPAARMSTSVDQSIAHNTLTATAFNVTDYDSYAARPEGAMVNLSTDVITIRKTGLYVICNKVTFASNATGVRRLDLNVNGVLEETHANGAFTGANLLLYMTTLRPLTAGDTLTSSCFQTSGGALNALFATKGTMLGCAWVGSLS